MEDPIKPSDLSPTTIRDQTANVVSQINQFMRENHRLQKSGPWCTIPLEDLKYEHDIGEIIFENVKEIFGPYWQINDEIQPSGKRYLTFITK